MYNANASKVMRKKKTVSSPEAETNALKLAYGRIESI